MITFQLSLAELKSALAEFGYVLKKSGDELEVYPKGERGAKSYFTNDRRDAINTARAIALAEFRIKVRNVMHADFHEEHREALVLWFEVHGVKWAEELSRAWYSGNYGGVQQDGTLQRLRNTCGHEVLHLLGIY